MANNIGVAVSQVIKALEPLGALLGKSATQLWEMALQEVAVDRALSKLWIGVWGAIFTILLFFTFYIPTLTCIDDFGAQAHCTCGYFLGIPASLCFFITVNQISNLISQTFNPQYRALLYILHMVPGND